MEVVIDLNLIKTSDDFYDQLASQVDFGPFFGRNLDAFWDYIGLLEEKKLSFINYSLLSDDVKSFFLDIISMISEYNSSLIRIGVISERLIHISICDYDSPIARTS